jgi:broad specificity phosphatase PhoE
MALVVLIRHGETDWNRSGRIMGLRPVPLNQNGITQAARLAIQLSALSSLHLYTSPMSRTKQTAEILAATLRATVTEEADLREIGVGDWEGHYWNEFDGHPARTDWYTSPHEVRPPGGETLAEVQQRAVAAVARILSLKERGPALLVTHADVIRTIVAHYLEMTLQTVRHLQIDHASVTTLAVTGSSGRLLCLNSLPDLNWIK